jgi:hypothetical protein
MRLLGNVKHIFASSQRDEDVGTSAIDLSCNMKNQLTRQVVLVKVPKVVHGGHIMA